MVAPCGNRIRLTGIDTDGGGGCESFAELLLLLLLLLCPIGPVPVVCDAAPDGPVGDVPDGLTLDDVTLTPFDDAGDREYG